MERHITVPVAKEEIQDAGYPGVEEIYEKILRKNQPNHHLNRQ